MKTIEFVPLLLTETTDIFTIRSIGHKDTEFRKFLILFKESKDPFLKEDMDRILTAIEKISQNGALENYFRIEGKITDRVCAIPLLVKPRDKSKHGTLRLYCIRVSDTLLIIGGGGVKKSSTYEDDPELYPHVALLQSIDRELSFLEKEGKILNDDLLNLTIEIE